MDFLKIFSLAQEVLSKLGVLQENFNKVKDSLSISDQEKLNAVLDEIHQKNLELSSQIDSAASEAEKL